MIKWTPKSENDLNEILEHIAKHHGATLAIETISDLVNQVDDTLTNNPLQGNLVETNPLFSRIIIKGNSIYYCEHPKNRDIYIVYVRARKKDLELERLVRVD